MPTIEFSFVRTWSTMACTARFTRRTFTALPRRMSVSTSRATWTDCAYVRLAASRASSSSRGSGAAPFSSSTRMRRTGLAWRRSWNRWNALPSPVSSRSSSEMNGAHSSRVTPFSTVMAPIP